MDLGGATRPEADTEAEVTLRDHPVSVSTRVERVETSALVVRPSAGEWVEEHVVRVGDEVQVSWRGSSSAWVLPAQVTTVERGAVPRWHLDITGPAEVLQRREAVRARLALTITTEVHGVELEGEVLDLSEGGVRLAVDGFGIAPLPGTVVPLTVQLEDGVVAARAEVLRQRSRGPRCLVSLRFADLPEKDQDRLRRRVFQAMREERARGSA